MVQGDALGDNGNGIQRKPDFAPWPDWKVGHLPSLARYVSVPALDEIGLPECGRYTEKDLKRGREIACRIYESIRALGLHYLHEPWRAERFGYQDFEPRQRVRYPAWVRRDSGGTCLDLAILYATALMRAQIRPHIVILDPEERAGSPLDDSSGHAFVLADLRAPLTDQHWEPSVLSPLERSASPDGEAGSLVIRAGRELPPYLLAVDPSRATVGFPLGGKLFTAAGEEFALSTAAASAYLIGGEARLCDVATARFKGTDELPRPADSATPAIWTRLPELPELTEYNSRQDTLARLVAARGRIVIFGPQGFGKSMLACIRARSADGGYGWFLNAADRSTLQAQLARAEIDQRARSYPRTLEKLDQTPFSDLAVRRLEMSDAPWVLVLDNADGKPDDVIPLLPRAIGPDQTIIVTTTNRDWLEEWPASGPGPTATHVILDPLVPADMPGISTELHALTGGSPLFYEAVRAALKVGARIPAKPEQAAGLVWQLAREPLSGCPGALDLARLIAWAPPVALPLADFAALFPDCAPPAGLDGLGRALEAAGIARFLTHPGPAVIMHRLIATRIRDDHQSVRLAGQPPLPAPVALLAADAGQQLMIRLGDAESFTRLERTLSGAPGPRVPVRSWGLAVYGVARAGEIRGRSESSSALFEQAIEMLDPDRDQSLLSECWYGRARYRKDNPPSDATERDQALAAALSWSLTAEELARQSAAVRADREQQLWDLVRVERARAMQALVKRKQAGDIADQSLRKARLAEAREILGHSEARRGDYLQELGRLGELDSQDSPDVDRARFNLGGSDIGLAKLSRDAEAEDYLRSALAEYEQAKQTRVRRYGKGIALPAIAACDNGIALACFYSALLKADPRRDPTDSYRPASPQARMALLRQASAACADALRDRTVLAPADQDDLDAVKSDDLTIKISQMRKLLSRFHDKSKGGPLTLAEAARVLDYPQTADLAERKLPEVLKEARDLAGIIKPEQAG